MRGLRVCRTPRNARTGAKTVTPARKASNGMSRARVAGIAVCLGAVGLLVGGATGIFAVTWSVLGATAASLLAIGVCIALEKRWAVLIGRVALWPAVIVAAFMMVPDREEAA